MTQCITLMSVIAIVLESLFANAKPANAEQNTVIAINIALDPDATMLTHAETANARLLKSYPEGFMLDASHRPHITILQRYVRTENLKIIFSEIGKILADEQVTHWKLKAIGYYDSPWKAISLGGISIESYSQLVDLQQKLIAAISPFAEKTGTAAAFVTTPEEPEIDQTTINYVETFVPEKTGNNYNPHLTIGLALQDTLHTMSAKPFNSFTFSPAGVSVYQIGKFGTARKILQTWGSSQ